MFSEYLEKLRSVIRDVENGKLLKIPILRVIYDSREFY